MKKANTNCNKEMNGPLVPASMLDEEERVVSVVPVEELIRCNASEGNMMSGRHQDLNCPDVTEKRLLNLAKGIRRSAKQGVGNASKYLETGKIEKTLKSQPKNRVLPKTSEPRKKKTSLPKKRSSRLEASTSEDSSFSDSEDWSDTSSSSSWDVYPLRHSSHARKPRKSIQTNKSQRKRHLSRLTGSKG